MQSQKIKVFLVEDAEIVRRRLIETLCETGFVEIVGYADSEQDAISGIRCAEADAVIVDLQLREGSGLNVLKQVKDLKFPRPKLLVLTNYAFPEYLRRCKELGADYFFDKSTEFDQVRNALIGESKAA